jgi:hypothetical protein
MPIRVKRGTTLSLACQHRLSGTAVDLTGYTVSSQAKRGGTSNAFTVTLADQTTDPGEFTLSADTTTWTAGDWRVDVRFVDGSERYYSETFDVAIVEPVTV